MKTKLTREELLRETPAERQRRHAYLQQQGQLVGGRGDMTLDASKLFEDAFRRRSNGSRKTS